MHSTFCGVVVILFVAVQDVLSDHLRGGVIFMVRPKPGGRLKEVR